MDVHAEVLSNHAIRLYFDYVTPVAGSYTRISRDPLFEWHSFATIPLSNQKGYSLVVSRAGDWTGKTIEEPPTKLWVRGVVSAIVHYWYRKVSDGSLLLAYLWCAQNRATVQPAGFRKLLRALAGVLLSN